MPPQSGSRLRRLPREETDEQRDARRWRALMSSARIRVLTTTPQPHSRPVPGARYILIEFWSKHDIPETRLSAHLLIDYVDHIREGED